MKKLLIATLLSLPLAGHAAIEQSQLTSKVELRQPVDNLRNEVIGSKGKASKVFFFTRVSDMKGEILVHKWLYQGKSMAEVKLAIGNNNWRTYSSKNILPKWQGAWQVQVWHKQQKLLEHNFVYQSE